MTGSANRLASSLGAQRALGPRPRPDCPQIGSPPPTSPRLPRSGPRVVVHKASLSLPVCRGLLRMEESSPEGLESTGGRRCVTGAQIQRLRWQIRDLLVPFSVSEQPWAPLECDPDGPGGFLLTLVLERGSWLTFSGCTAPGGREAQQGCLVEACRARPSPVPRPRPRREGRCPAGPSEGCGPVLLPGPRCPTGLGERPAAGRLGRSFPIPPPPTDRKVR